MEKIYWKPSEELRHSSAMSRFASFFAKKIDKNIKDYESLCDASIQKFPQFWKEYLQFSELVYEGPLLPVQVEAPEFRNQKFFPNLKLSYPENLLRRFHDDEEIILVGLCEDSSIRREWSLAKAKKAIAAIQSKLKKAGVAKGDRVAALMPNSPEVVIAMMAATGLGAIWSSCSPDFGEKGILDRFSQIEPKFLFVSDSVIYNGKTFNLEQKNSILIKALPSLKAHHCFKQLVSNCEEAINLKGSLESASEKLSAPQFLRVEFNDPLFIMFSSGTTGTPKCIVHGVGGTLLQHSKEHQLHCDLKSQEKILYYTTCGWMMWNWVVSALLQGAKLFCYDGSPAAPNVDSMWEIADREELNVFGTSAKFIASCRNQNLEAKKKYQFKNLRLVLSTGSPLLPEDFDYFYTYVESQNPLQLASISGGTDILSCFMLGNPLKPVVRGEIQGRGLGMDVQAWNDQGHPVVGEQGELVCCRPFPSMPTEFWNDPSGEKYQSAYFRHFPNIWHHGDYVEMRPNGGIVIYGRSDATLNPGGVRIGTAEIYRQVETHPLVADSLAVGKMIDGDEEVQLFVKLKPANPLSDSELEEFNRDIKTRIRSGASPRHVPKKIFIVKDIPYTVSGKKVEIAIKKILHGQDPGNREALANPDSLEEYKKFI